MADAQFPSEFEALTGHRPLPWQERLFSDWFMKGDIPGSCDLPTGLGKTSVMAIWLIALARAGATLPRRLVYVVNRRTVVDQATREAEKLLANLDKAGLTRSLHRLCAIKDEPPLAISTLRGQFADNARWSADPSRPAIIVGTVDMIGSRLLFSGYGVGFKRKPLHAGFLGQDTLLVHDESHLEPAFQTLLETITAEQARERTCGGDVPWPGVRVMPLSATLRRGSTSADVFSLDDADHRHPIVRKRVHATKTLRLHEVEEKKVATELVAHALRHKDSGQAVLIFARTVKEVEQIARQLPAESTEQLTGTMRGLERDALVRRSWFQRFLPESDCDPSVTATAGTAYLVCTSAGEVGVNISADHLVCDLSTFDSMAQRFGRVNRFGDCDNTQIDVFHPRSFDNGPLAPERQRTLALLRQLGDDASPAKLSMLDAASRQDAYAPPPTILPTTDILFDAWALTTIREKLPGRPAVAPYLHGLSGWEPPYTQVAWREEVGIITGDDLRDRYPPRELLERYPLKPHELLRDASGRVFEQLKVIARRCPDAWVWLLDGGEVQPLNIVELTEYGEERIADCTLLLPPAVGGLSERGTLDSASETAGDVADEWYEDPQHTIRRRCRKFDDSPISRVDDRQRMRSARPPIDTRPELESDDEPAEAGDPGRGRYWHWFVRPASSDDESSRAARQPILWDIHTDDVIGRTRQIVGRLPLPTSLKQAILVAARFHDMGKKRALFQLSIGNRDRHMCYAKGGGPMWPIQITHYRHELGSLLDVEGEAELQQLSEEMKDVVLHLIAAHHGRARPHFPHGEDFDPEPADRDVAACVVQVPRRFARLQRRYGRWGLAYLESLLRAADWAASANPSQERDADQQLAEVSA